MSDTNKEKSKRPLVLYNPGTHYFRRKDIETRFMTSIRNRIRLSGALGSRCVAGGLISLAKTYIHVQPGMFTGRGHCLTRIILGSVPSARPPAGHCAETFIEQLANGMAVS